MNELKLRDGIVLNLAKTIVITLGVLLILATCSLVAYLSGRSVNTQKIILIVSACIIAFIWFVYLMLVLFSKKIIINNDEIKATIFGKKMWEIKKEDIRICIYNELRWFMIIFAPLDSINAGALQFRMKTGKISRHCCSLTQRQVNKIKANFDYPFKEILTIYEQ